MTFQWLEDIYYICIHEGKGELVIQKYISLSLFNKQLPRHRGAILKFLLGMFNRKSDIEMKTEFTLQCMYLFEVNKTKTCLYS